MQPGVGEAGDRAGYEKDGFLPRFGKRMGRILLYYNRLKHIIISGGENISPKEVESVLDRHPEIFESCVVGIPDERWGEKVVAGIVLRPGAALTREKIKNYCKEHLLDWKCPKEFFLLKESRNRMGKVMKDMVNTLKSGGLA
jgi:acyl-CoA synthetase (AMP-forming)/AMP-acid ligase II